MQAGLEQFLLVPSAPYNYQKNGISVSTSRSRIAWRLRYFGLASVVRQFRQFLQRSTWKAAIAVGVLFEKLVVQFLQFRQLHFILFPFPAQGHMIPMIDTARLLAQRGILVTIITTPMNAALFKAVLDRAVQGGLRSSYPSTSFGFHVKKQDYLKVARISTCFRQFTFFPTFWMRLRRCNCHWTCLPKLHSLRHVFALDGLYRLQVQYSKDTFHGFRVEAQALY